MKMYVANGTHQVQAFTYRLPETHQARLQPIGVGQQVLISGNISTPDIEAIIRQYSKYGMIEAAEIGTSRKAAPFAYQLDKPMNSEQITALTHQNAGILTDLGRKVREEAAQVLTNKIGADMRNSGSESELDHVEVSVTEEPTKGAPAGAERVEEVTVVSREDRQDPRNKQRRK